MRGLLVLLLACAVSCATSPVAVTYTATRPGGVPKLSSVTISPKAYGRVCYDMQVKTDGTVAVTVAQDGTSDWIGVRVLPSILPEVVGAVMAVIGAPIQMILAALGVDPRPLPGPSSISACSALFE